MKRRHFLETASMTAATWMLGCSSVHTTVEGEPDAGPASPDATSPGDGGTFVQSDAPALLDASTVGPLVIHESFNVVLNDANCSHHNHDANVMAGTYAEDVEIAFNGPGGHGLKFWVSELVRLQNGERIPFATDGLGGHGHCGTAWRSELGSSARPEPETEICNLRAPATNMQCAARPRM